MAKTLEEEEVVMIIEVEDLKEEATTKDFREKIMSRSKN